MSDEKPRNGGGDRPMRRRGGAGAKLPQKPARSPEGKKDAAKKPRVVKTRPAPPERSSAFEGERIAKVMARAGACSRRDAEQWIAEGRVAVNGRVLASPAVNVREGDKITVDGKPLAERERTRLFLFHKPAGLVTSAKDPEGRETVFAYLDAHHPELPRLVSVGRLDINTEGLLLLTNDGGLARTLELPATGWTRRYRVRAHGEIDQAQLDALKQGVSVEGVDYAPIEARLDRVQGANAWITMSLTEGKNREIKRVLDHLGLDVTRLIRVSYGPFQLGELAEGAVEEVRLKVLRDQLGKGLAELAGVDFSSPLRETPTATEEQQRREALQKRPRKHVSALRKERDEEQAPRARIERGMTADRKGRAVAVERVIVKREKPAAEGRNARRFAALRGEAEPREARGERRPPREERAPRGERSFDREARAGRAPREGAKRFGEGRPPREERAPRGERSFDREARPARAPREGAKRFGEGRPPREERAPRGERSFDREARPARAPREGAKRSGEGRPPRGPRAEGGAKSGARSGGPKGGGPKSGGGKSFDARKPGGPRGGGRGPGGGKPRGGKPGAPRKPRG